MYHDNIRDGEGTFSYLDGTKDCGIWKDCTLVQLNFPAYGINFNPYVINLRDPAHQKKEHNPPSGRLEVTSKIFCHLKHLLIHFIYT